MHFLLGERLRKTILPFCPKSILKLNPLSRLPDQWFSCGLQSSSMNDPWKLVRCAKSWAHPGPTDMETQGWAQGPPGKFGKLRSRQLAFFPLGNFW